MIGVCVGAVVPTEDENVGVAAALIDPAVAFLPTSGLLLDREAGSGRPRVSLVPGLQRGRLLDLNPQRAVGLLEVERRPIAGAQHPVRLERHRHNFLDQLAAKVVADYRLAEAALGETGDDRKNNLAGRNSVNRHVIRDTVFINTLQELRRYVTQIP